MRRFTRLTNAHSRKFANHCHMIALYADWYDFVRTARAVRMPAALAAGITDRAWDRADIVNLIDDAAPQPRPRGLYRKNSN